MNQPAPRTILPILIALCVTLIFFVWAGSGSDPRFVLPWDFNSDDWLEPARGLTMLLVGAVALFGILSLLAWRLFTVNTSHRSWLSAFLILDFAILVRLVVAITWLPLPHDAASMSGPVATLHLLHWLAVTSDIGVIVLLLLALRKMQRSPWWAALYAFHPLPLLVITGHFPILPVVLLPILVLLVFLPQFRFLYVPVASLGAIVMTAALSAGPPFNSFLADLVALATPHPGVILIILQTIVQTLLLFVASKNRWPTARVLGHAAVLFLLITPVFTPAFALPALLLLPLAWNRAGWMLTILSFTAYLAIPVFAATHTWHIPAMFMLLAWLPPAVMEVQELFRAGLEAQNSPLAPTPQPH